MFADYHLQISLYFPLSAVISAFTSSLSMSSFTQYIHLLVGFPDNPNVIVLSKNWTYSHLPINKEYQLKQYCSLTFHYTFQRIEEGIPTFSTMEPGKYGADSHQPHPCEDQARGEGPHSAGAAGR